MRKRKGIDVRVDAFAAQGAARRMCESNSLQVRFDLKPGEVPHTKEGVVHISPPMNGMSTKDLNNWWGQLIHETKHNTPRGKKGAKVLKNRKLEDNSVEKGLLELFEDTTIDAIGVGEYLGQDESSSVYASEMFEVNASNPEMKRLLWENSELDEGSIVVGTSLLTDAFVRQNFQPDLSGRYHEILDNPNLHPEIKSRFEKTVADGWADELAELPEHEAEALHEWFSRWLKAVHELDPPPPPPKKQSQSSPGEGEGDEKPQKEDNDSDEESNDEETSVRLPGEGKEAEKGKETERGEDKEKPLESKQAQIIFKEVERDDHAKLDFRGESRRGSGQTVKYEDSYSGKYRVTPAHRFTVVNYHTKKVLDGAGYPSINAEIDSFRENVHGSYSNLYRDKRDQLPTKVKRYIQSETRTRTWRNRKKGKLDQRKLFKLGVEGAGSDWQDRVFWQRDIKASVKETIVSLLCDFSGSMHGDKIETAIQAMDKLGDVCESLGINYEMAGFTSSRGMGGAAPLHLLFKPFNTKVQRSKIREYMEEAICHMSQNADGENILHAYNRIMAVEAKRRVLIVLSDGQPAAAGGDIARFTLDVTSAIEAGHHVELHGIGIMDASVRHYYKNHSVLQRADQLEEALLTVLKNNVIRIK